MDSDEERLVLIHPFKRNGVDPFYSSAEGESLDVEANWQDHCHRKRESVAGGHHMRRSQRKLLVALVLVFVFMLAELIGGILANSLAIATDAAHLVTDFAGFGINLMSLSMAGKSPTRRFNFGWHRLELLGALASIVLLWLVTVILMALAVMRLFQQDYTINPRIMLVMAVTGVVFNLLQSANFCGVHGHSHSDAKVAPSADNLSETNANNSKLFNKDTPVNRGHGSNQDGQIQVSSYFDSRDDFSLYGTKSELQDHVDVSKKHNCDAGVWLKDLLTGRSEEAVTDSSVPASDSMNSNRQQSRTNIHCQSSDATRKADVATSQDDGPHWCSRHGYVENPSKVGLCGDKRKADILGLITDPNSHIRPPHIDLQANVDASRHNKELHVHRTSEGLYRQHIGIHVGVPHQNSNIRHQNCGLYHGDSGVRHHCGNGPIGDTTKNEGQGQSHTNGDIQSNDRRPQNGDMRRENTDKLQRNTRGPEHEEGWALQEPDIEELSEYSGDSEKGQEGINVRAAMIHVLGDLAQSVGVLIAAVILYHQPEWKLVDPVCTFTFSVVVMATTAPLVREITILLMEGTPSGLDHSRVLSDLQRLSGVRQVHDLRLWGLTSQEMCASAHLVLGRSAATHPLSVSHEAHTLLTQKYGINHVTVQLECYSDVISECATCQRFTSD